MNDELYQMLTLDRVRDIIHKDGLYLSPDDIDTIIAWLKVLDKELYELREHFHRKRLGWKEQQKILGGG